MTRQMETLKEQLKSKDKELGAMEDELDSKNAEINSTSQLGLHSVYTSFRNQSHCSGG